MNCRHCENPLQQTFLDLGFAPPSNAYLAESDLLAPETYFPLKVMVCEKCWLVQTEDYSSADDLFQSDYAYFSSTSSSWLKHASDYTDAIIKQLRLDQDSLVIEVASNDGYLLKNFIEAGIPCLGIEPTDGTAIAAEKIGISVIREFFGEKLGKKLANEGQAADLIAGNNVYAHVPDINDFTRGLAAALKPEGVITLEFPHLLKLIEARQFDTIYHEHFSYLSLQAVVKIFEAAGLRIWDVEQLPTHGGSLRIYGCHATDSRNTTDRVEEILGEEVNKGLQEIATYQAFQTKADEVKDKLVSFLIEQKALNKCVIAYGAAAKGNTLLNYGGIKPDLLPIVFDGAKSKQGKFMPGSHIPIASPEVLNNYKPDYILILPWNIADEIIKDHILLADNGVKFVTAVPELKIHNE